MNMVLKSVVSLAREATLCQQGVGGRGGYATGTAASLLT